MSWIRPWWQRLTSSSFRSSCPTRARGDGTPRTEAELRGQRRHFTAQGRCDMNSCRVSFVVRNVPRTLLVTIVAPLFWTPRIARHRCSDADAVGVQSMLTEVGDLLRHRSEEHTSELQSRQ